MAMLCGVVVVVVVVVATGAWFDEDITAFPENEAVTPSKAARAAVESDADGVDNCPDADSTDGGGAGGDGDGNGDNNDKVGLICNFAIVFSNSVDNAIRSSAL
jgi:hypothetical protein